jgi:hypothetical protein
MLDIYRDGGVRRLDVEVVNAESEVVVIFVRQQGCIPPFCCRRRSSLNNPSEMHQKLGPATKGANLDILFYTHVTV